MKLTYVIADTHFGHAKMLEPDVGRLNGLVQNRSQGAIQTT